MSGRVVVGDFGTGAAPSVGAVYTDAATVKRVQAALKINVDGKIGPQTKTAVQSFNTSRGVPGDGSNITDGTLAAISGLEYQAQQAALVAQQAASAQTAAAAKTVTAPAGLAPSAPVTASAPMAATAAPGMPGAVTKSGLFGLETWQLATLGIASAAILTGVVVLIAGGKKK